MGYRGPCVVSELIFVFVWVLPLVVGPLGAALFLCGTSSRVGDSPNPPPVHVLNPRLLPPFLEISHYPLCHLLSPITSFPSATSCLGESPSSRYASISQNPYRPFTIIYLQLMCFSCYSSFILSKKAEA